ncbi:unnamed protein product [Chrysoparadoxa australica]
MRADHAATQAKEAKMLATLKEKAKEEITKLRALVAEKDKEIGSLRDEVKERPRSVSPRPLSMKAVELVEVVRKLKDELAEKDQKVFSSEQCIESLQAQLAGARAADSEEVQGLQLKIEELAKELQRVNSEASTHRDVIARRTSELTAVVLDQEDEAKGGSEEMWDKLAEAQARVLELEEAGKGMAETIASLKVGAEEREEALTQSKANLSRALEVSSERAQLEGRMAAEKEQLVSEVEAVRVELGGAKEQVESVIGERDELRRQVGALEQQVVTVKAEAEAEGVSDGGEQVQALKGQLSNAESKVAELETAVRDGEEAARAVHEELAALKIAVAEGEAVAAGLREEVAAAAAAALATQGDEKGLEEELERARAKLSELEEALTRRDEREQALKEKVTSLEGELDGAARSSREVLEEVKGVLKASEAKCEGLERVRHGVLAELNGVRGELEKTKHELSARVIERDEAAKEAETTAGAWKSEKERGEALAREIDELKATARSVQRDMNGELGRVEAEGEALVESLRGDLRRKEIEVSEGLKSLEELKEKLHAQKVQSEAMRMESEVTVTSLRHQLSAEQKAGEDRKMKMKAYADALGQEKGSLEEEVGGYKGQVLELQQTVEGLNRRVAELEAEAEARRGELQAAQQQAAEQLHALEEEARAREMRVERDSSTAQEKVLGMSNAVEQHKQKRLAARTEVMQMAKALEAERGDAEAIDQSLQYTIMPKAQEQSTVLEHVVTSMDRSLQMLSKGTAVTVKRRFSHLFARSPGREDLDAPARLKRTGSDSSKLLIMSEGIEMAERGGEEDALEEQQEQQQLGAKGRDFDGKRSGLQEVERLEREMARVSAGLALVSQSMEQLDEMVECNSQGLCGLLMEWIVGRSRETVPYHSVHLHERGDGAMLI